MERSGNNQKAKKPIVNSSVASQTNTCSTLALTDVFSRYLLLICHLERLILFLYYDGLRLMLYQSSCPSCYGQRQTLNTEQLTGEMLEVLKKEHYFGEDSPLICDEQGNFTKPDIFRRRYHRLLEGAEIESKGLHSLRHTFATNLVNGVQQPDGMVKALTVKQATDLFGHSTTQVTEMYYVKKDTSMLNGITNDSCLYQLKNYTAGNKEKGDRRNQNSAVALIFLKLLMLF